MTAANPYDEPPRVARVRRVTACRCGRRAAHVDLWRMVYGLKIEWDLWWHGDTREVLCHPGSGDLLTAGPATV